MPSAQQQEIALIIATNLAYALVLWVIVGITWDVYKERRKVHGKR